MNMNRGKIFTKETNKEFKIRYGTINNKDMKSVFINFTSWISLADNYEENNLLINKLRKKLQKLLYENVNENIFTKDLFIVDLDIRESGLKNKTQTFMSLDINLYQKGNLNFKNKILHKEMDYYIEIIKNELSNFEEFKFTKQKKILN